MQNISDLKETFNNDNGLSGSLQTVISRFDAMDSAITEFKNERNITDQQFNANTFEDPYTGELIVNCNIEQQLIDYELGRTSADLIFDVKPGGYSTSVQVLESSKYVLQSFIDKEGFYDEYRNFKTDKSKYGTGIWFTGLRFDVEYIKNIEKQKVSVTEIGNGIFSNKYEEERKENWFFTPSNIPIRSFRIDDRALRQSNFNKAEDCILIETLTKSQLQSKYGDVSNINKDALNLPVVQEENPAYGIPSIKGMMVLYHYYNKTTKDYIIVVNRRATLYEGKMVYKNGKLPFDVCQHYPDTSCIYGIGICRRVRLWKAYKNNLAQSALRSTRLSSGKIVALGSGSENIDGDFYVPSGGIGIARLTGGIADMRDIDTRTDIQGQINMMSIIDQEIRDATGHDIRSAFEVSDSTLGQTEIREQNKAIRYKAVDEMMQLSLDRILTSTLSNIQQFAPSLLGKKTVIKGKDGKVESSVYQYPVIQINNVSIEKKKGEITITDDYGNFGYMELKPETLNGELTVNIVTPATNNLVMQTIGQNKFTELTTNISNLANLYGPEFIQEQFPPDQMAQKFKSAYQIDQTQITADTKKDKISRQNKKDIDEIQNILKEMRDLSQLQQNGEEQQQSLGQTPGISQVGSNVEIQGGGAGGEMPGVGLL